MVLHTAAGAIATTPEHPFAVAGRGWTPAMDLRVGDHVVSANHEKTATILGVERKLETRLVYNLTVDVAHTYFVGSDALLVHNQCQRDYAALYPRVADFLRGHPDVTAIMAYTTKYAKSINKALRDDPNMPLDQKQRWLAFAARAETALRDAIARGLSFHGTVERGISGRAPRQLLDGLRNLRPGDTWREDGFLSTSVEPPMAATYAGESGIIMKIESRSGVPVEGVSEIPFDREVLFPPGTSLRLLSTSTDAEGRLVLNFAEAE